MALHLKIEGVWKCPGVDRKGNAVRVLEVLGLREQVAVSAELVTHLVVLQFLLHPAVHVAIAVERLVRRALPLRRPLPLGHIAALVVRQLAAPARGLVLELGDEPVVRIADKAERPAPAEVRAGDLGGPVLGRLVHQVATGVVGNLTQLRVHLAPDLAASAPYLVDVLPLVLDRFGVEGGHEDERGLLLAIALERHPLDVVAKVHGHVHEGQVLLEELLLHRSLRGLYELRLRHILVHKPCRPTGFRCGHSWRGGGNHFGVGGRLLRSNRLSCLRRGLLVTLLPGRRQGLGKFIGSDLPI
mmetsp:Transcript_102651/g.306566  ORF Transcript_102651/g.306566 Transcript_102651/m.306566 type:complete len:300 (-) Transcript_102651:244-1143(-)